MELVLNNKNEVFIRGNQQNVPPENSFTTNSVKTLPNEASVANKTNQTGRFQTGQKSNNNFKQV